jgi:tRNA-binding protein
MTPPITYEEFEKVDIRVGRVITAETFPEARKPAYRLTIDFGEEIGVKRSSAQITVRYNPEDLVGKLVLAVVNFPSKRIGPFVSEVLTLGFMDAYGDIVLAKPEADVPLGSRLF